MSERERTLVATVFSSRNNFVLFLFFFVVSAFERESFPFIRHIYADFHNIGVNEGERERVSRRTSEHVKREPPTRTCVFVYFYE